jgi:hypothetical protein
MRDLFLVLGSWAALAACDPRIYIDEPLESPPDSGIAADAEAPPPPPPPPEPAPQISCASAALDFGAVLPGNTQTLVTTCNNTGDAALFVSQIQFTGANPAFTFETDRGPAPFMLPPAATVAIEVHYSPLGSAPDSDTLLINSDDPDTANMEIEVFGGAVPRLRVDPADTLFIPYASAPSTAQLVISNVGLGDLLVERIVITGPAPSVDDFTILECSNQNPCELSPPLTLCPPMSASCVGPSSHALTVVYANNDISNVDFAELHLETNDPADPEHVVVFEAEDHPCLFPVPAITVVPPQPCVGMPVLLSSASSTAGGRGSTITAYHWSWLFTPPSAPAINPSSTSSTATFIPIDSGVHVIGLYVRNDCGAESPSPATETIDVAAICP